MATPLGKLVIEIGADINSFRKGLLAVGNRLDRLGSRLTSIGTSLSSALTVPLAAIGGGALKAAIDFESSFTGVRKTVDATEAEFQALAGSFRDMAKEVPASVNEINSVAEAAGQLGIETKNIASFTRSMIDLGETTNLSANAAATALARFMNIMGTEQGNVDRLGSTIVQLGNNLATTEAEIVEMALRLAGAGKLAGLTEAQVLGLSGALSSMGIQSEVGGSTMQTAFLRMQSAVAAGGDSLAQFASTAGMTATQFAALWKRDPVAAMLAFVEGVKKASDAGVPLQQALLPVANEMGVVSIRLMRTMATLATNTDLVTGSIKMATQEWKDNTALTKEAELRYNTIASLLKIVKNNFHDIAITLGEALIPALLLALEALTPWTERLAELVQRFVELDPATQIWLVEIAAIAAALGPVLIILGQLASGLGSLISLLGLILSPWGLVIGALVAAALAIKHLWETNEQFRAAALAAWEWIQKKAIEIFTDLAKFWHDHGDEVFETLETVWTEVTGLLIDVWNGIEKIAIRLWEGLRDFWEVWGESILQLMADTWEGILFVVEEVWPAIREVVRVGLDLIAELVSLFFNILTGDWEGAWQNLGVIAEGIWAAMGAGWELVGEHLITIGEGIGRDLLAIWQGVVDQVKAVINALITAAEIAINAAIVLLNSFITLLNDVIWVMNQVPGVALAFVPTVGFLDLPQLALGGQIVRTGAAIVHAGEVVTPAAAVRAGRGGGGVTIHAQGLVHENELWTLSRRAGIRFRRSNLAGGLA